MAERSEVLRVQNDALLNEYHHLILAQVRRIDEALNVLDHERRNLVAERDHLTNHLPKPVEQQKDAEIQRLPQDKMPKFIQKGPAT